MSGELPLERAHLARELAGLRATTGLSLAGLAARTTASKSSWQRYLGGTQIPPPHSSPSCAPSPANRPRPPAGPARTGRTLPAPPAPPPRASRSARARGAEPEGRARHGEEPPAVETPDAGRPHAPPPAAPVPFFRRRKAALAGAGVLATAAMVAGALLLGGAGQEPEGTGLWPGCVGERCRGKDSQAQGCGLKGSGMRTAAERAFGRQTVVELRYSPSCRASWVRVRFGSVGDRIEITGPDKESQSVEVADKFDAQNYLPTPMLAGGPEGMTACLVRAGSGERHCFGR
ncbi:XRE family transcriptional regulator [Streptomyces albus]|nr:XRE family transcriptional regulator [Streptomyces albus]